MKFFKTRIFIATLFFAFGMAVMWLWGAQRGLSIQINQQHVEEDPFMESLRQMQTMQQQAMQMRGSYSFGEPEIVETDNGYELNVDLDGMTPQNFSVQIEGTQLMLQGTLESNEGDGQIQSHFQRSFPVPSDVDANGIQVKNREGGLVVILPKKSR